MAASNTQKIPNFFNIFFAVDIGHGYKVNSMLDTGCYVIDVFRIDNRQLKLFLMVYSREVAWLVFE